MRATLTLDDDVAAKLKAEARRSGRPFKEIVNETLRSGLSSRRATPRQPFKIAARDLGQLSSGLPSTMSPDSSSRRRARFTGDPDLCASVVLRVLCGDFV